MSWLRDTWSGLIVTSLVMFVVLFSLLLLGFELAGVPLWSRILQDLGVNA